jgi:2-polyprenyl-3-methyl-5-hydroxy-6-metoxy-1,4-benzoquinol methylase
MAYDSCEMRKYLRETLSPILHELDMTKLSQHNAGLLRYGRNAEERFNCFVEAEYQQFDTVFKWASINLQPGTSILEVGCLIPTIPAGLKKLGFEVSAVDNTALYGDAFAPIQLWCDRNGVTFFDLDILTQSNRLPSFPVITLINVVEHLNGSPKRLLESLVSKLQPGGHFLFCVPNIASITRRLQMIHGNSPLPSYEDYWLSDYPFGGHNREYTLKEACHCLKASGLSILEQILLPTTFSGRVSMKAALAHLLERIGPRTWRYLIFLIAQKLTPSENGE